MFISLSTHLHYITKHLADIHNFLHLELMYRGFTDNLLDLFPLWNLSKIQWFLHPKSEYPSLFSTSPETKVTAAILLEGEAELD